MYFESAEDIKKIAEKNNTSIFVIPKNTPVNIKNALILEPTNRTIITIEQVREILMRTKIKQTGDLFIIIRPAESLGLEAANALLKSLEEPGDKIHFVLITDTPSSLLPTILSRASLYILRTPRNNDIDADPKIKELSKRLLVAKGPELVDIAEEITKKKDNVRNYAMEVLGVAIEMLYKSYYITGKETFLKKLPNFLQAYENISKNGHVKLQIVSNLC